VIEGNRFTLGELDGAQRAHRRAVAGHDPRRLQGAGVEGHPLEIWVKLWGNLSFNPISALTHATLEDICRFPPTRALAAA
jgi:2-dehydropantoate 2-reductase